MLLSTWKPRVWYHSMYSVPSITMTYPPLSSLHWCWHLVCLMIIWCVSDGWEFERHFVQLEMCSKFPPVPDRDEVALWEDTVAQCQVREPNKLLVEQVAINEHGKPPLFNAKWHIMNIPSQLKTDFDISLFYLSTHKAWTNYIRRTGLVGQKERKVYWITWWKWLWSCLDVQ
jgi:hypothetical protein